MDRAASRALRTDTEALGDITQTLFFGLLYLGAFLVSTLFPSTHGLVLALWPAGGIGLAAFLSLPKRRWPLLAVLLYAIGLGANIASGRPIVASFGFMAANLSESVVSALVIGAFSGTQRTLRRTWGIAGLLLSALGVNAATASLGALVAWLSSGAHFASFWFDWWIADGMSILVVMPAVLAFFGPGKRDKARRSPVEYLVAYLLVLGIAWLVFNGRSVDPVFHLRPYLVIVICAWPAIRFGERGLSALLLAVAALALASGSVRTGPSSLGGNGMVERLLITQGFIAVCATCCWILRTERAQSEAVLRESEASRLFLKGIGDSIPNGFIYYYSAGPRGEWLGGYVSQGVERACGAPPERVLEDPGLLWRGLVPEDRTALAATQAAATAGRKNFQAVYRRRDAEGRIRWFLDSARPNEREDGSLEWTGIELDITAQEALVTSLRESESRFETYFRNSPVPTLITRTSDGSILDANRAFEEAFGHARAEILGRRTLEIGLYEDPSERGRLVGRMAKEGNVIAAEIGLRRRDGAPLLAAVFFAALRIGAEEYILAQFRDVTEERRNLAEIREREILLALSQEIAHVGHWIWQPSTDRLAWSDEMYRIYGIQRGEIEDGGDLEGVIRKIVHPDDRAAILGTFEQVRTEGRLEALEYRLVRPDGKLRQVWASPGQVERDGEGRVTRIYGVVQDITERKRELERVESALAERESLLRELNHRTNNSLQVSIAILGALAMRTGNAEAKVLLGQAQERIEAMAIVQKKMYEGRDLAHVDLAGIVRDLWRGLAASRGIPAAKVATDFRLGPAPVLVDTAIPFALAVNELLSNVADHAFPGERCGTLAVSLEMRDDLVVMELGDDGVGLPPGFDPSRDGGLGIDFVIGLCESQLRGELSFRLEKGFGCRLAFRDNLYTARV